MGKKEGRDIARPVDPDRKAEVLDLAVAFLAENGLSGLTLRKLALSMGVSTNTLSYQFGSKEGLVEAALARARSSSLDLFERMRKESPEITVAEAVRRLWSWWREDPARFVFTRLNMEAMMTANDVDLAPGKRPELLSFWVTYFSEWLTREGHSEEGAIDYATLLLDTLSGLVMDYVSTADGARVDRALLLLVRILEPQYATQRR